MCLAAVCPFRVCLLENQPIQHIAQFNRKINRTDVKFPWQRTGGRMLGQRKSIKQIHMRLNSRRDMKQKQCE